MKLKRLLLLFGLVVITADASGQDPFRQSVRTTKPLSPAEQIKKFHLPPGFEIQLVAAAPQIQKPINLAFDARGRLWVSGSVEYPYAAEKGKGRDTIKVLEDTNGDGKADKITTFAHGLNIPIGLYPYKDGVVAYSIPDITFFRDTDGDGKADKREVLYKNLGRPRDVHGMQNAFRRGFDGWLYVCHGFSNTSTIRGNDGSRITLQSGNTYRIRLDGSRVEQFTWGQVNPFGMAVASNGDMFTADCHSKPLSLLIRGGYYPSFGKPHDGLGFVQPVMSHSHGSTAIAGAAFCTGNAFPKKYRGSLFVGNVMTGRVHHDSLNYSGGTVRAKEEADFLKCDDPWFRPVDIRFGPDGALYIADFYNRIIGHYEVPLDHPGRDKHRGRIWRVVYKGAKMSRPRDLSRSKVEELIAALGEANLTTRMSATDQLTDRIGNAAIGPLRKALDARPSATATVHTLWALHRLKALRPEQIVFAAKHSDSQVRIHTMRILSETPKWTPALKNAALRGLDDRHAVVRRCAADAIGRHPGVDAVRPLLAAIEQTRNDPHLRQALRIALRNQLRKKDRLAALKPDKLKPNDRATILGVITSIRTPAAAKFLIRSIQGNNIDAATLRPALAHAAKYVPADELDALVELARTKAGGDIGPQLALLESIDAGMRQRGVRATRVLRQWAESLMAGVLRSTDDASSVWSSASGANPWGLERRNSADGQRGTLFLSSLPGGERQTGVLRSRSFTIPKRLRFFICGHLGFPRNKPIPNNFIRLKLVKTDEVIAKQLPPRNDVARSVDWTLDKHAGKAGYLEIVDGINLNAYAWIAIARFDPPVVKVPTVAPRAASRRLATAASLVARFRLKKQVPQLKRVVIAKHIGWDARAAAARALIDMQPDARLAALANLIDAPGVADELRTTICRAVHNNRRDNIDRILQQTMRTLPSRLQRQVGLELASTKTGGEALLSLIAGGKASARLLRDDELRQKLLAAKPANVESRIKKLTAALPSLKTELQELITARVKGYRQATPSKERGHQIFTKTCAACHQVNLRGAVIGPQLDGIGNRGLERIVEDVLDPNRNVDKNFHTTVYALTNGKVIVGQFRRIAGKTVIVADRQGKEIAIPRRSIDIEKKTTLSLMPVNVGTQIKANDFYDLVAFLLSLRRGQAKTR